MQNSVEFDSELPDWQSNLIKEIIGASERFYCRPEEFEAQKENLTTSFMATFKEINERLNAEDIHFDLNRKPSSEEEYQKFVDGISNVLKTFDAHMHIQYLPDDIRALRKTSDNRQFIQDAHGFPPEKLLDFNQMNQDPRKNYGFVDDPNLCSLNVMSDNVIGKPFPITPSYILSTEGLFYVNGYEKKNMSLNELIIDNKDPRYAVLSEKLTKGSVPYDEILSVSDEEAIESITGHVRPKQDIPSSLGYLKINNLIDPSYGKNLSEEYQFGPNAIKKLNEIMETFEDKDGVILDLRKAPEGGSPEMVEYLISFFIAQKGMKIGDLVDRRFPERQENYVVKDTPTSLFDKPVRILTDETTYSAREAVAFQLQRLNTQLPEKERNRFQILGEGKQTVGGAHPTYSFPLTSDEGEMNKDILIWLACAASSEPDWEKIGVTPDIKVKTTEDALEMAIAHLTAPTASLASAPEKTRQFREIMAAGRPAESAANASIKDEDTMDDKRSITPFQTTPRPPSS